MGKRKNGEKGEEQKMKMKTRRRRGLRRSFTHLSRHPWFQQKPIGILVCASGYSACATKISNSKCKGTSFSVKILKEARDQSSVETSNIPTTQSQGSKSQAVFSYQYSRTANETSTPILATKNETFGNLRNCVYRI